MSIAAPPVALTRPVASTAVQESQAYRRDIDGLRAIAVLAVLVFHAFPSQLSGGFVGVDVFFVISGFLITKVILGALEKDRFSVLEFYVRRVRRIFPALLVVLLACLGFGWTALLAEDLAHLSKHIVGGATFLANIFLWSESGYFDKASAFKALLHLWSLGIEEQFYLAWPLLLAAAWRCGVSVRWLMALTALLSFAVNVLGVARHPVATFYSPASRAWELLAGALAAQFAGSSGSLRCGTQPDDAMSVAAPSANWRASASSMLGALLIAFCVFYLDAGRQFPGWWAVLPVLGAVLVLMAGPGAWLNRRLLSTPVMVGIGLISYPLYLWHWPLLTLVRGSLENGDTPAVRLLLVAASFVAAFLTWHLVERPLRFGGQGRGKALLLCVGMLAVAVLAAATYARGGVPSRYPSIIQNATQYDLDGYRAALRNRRCFMDLDQDATQYAAESVDAAPVSAPLWTLWGDSGAATLYPGLRTLATQSGKFRLAQFTSSLCPPMLGYESSSNAACRRNNDWTIAKLAQLKPDVVLLSGIWSSYDKSRLAGTIAALRAAGVGKVIVLGPAPTWKDTPSHIIFNLWKLDPLHRVPSARLDYAKYGAGEDSASGSFAAERAVREIARQSGASYVSLLDALCDARGCLMRESDRSGNAFYLDIVHLNKTGSDFTMRAVAGELRVE
jgi:peptidoglycan/LPS O-acetylase OafA/YrhL